MMHDTATFQKTRPAAIQAAWTLLESAFRFLTSDGRHFQILYLGGFLIYGVFSLGWDVDLSKMLLVVATCLATQSFFILYKGISWLSLKSAMISSLGLCILLKTNLPSTAVLAALITIASKFLIQYDRKHVFNPVNIGIVLTTLLTGDAWVSPGQWGSDFTTLYFVGAAGLIVLLKVGRIDISLAFIAVFFGLELIWSMLYLGWPADHFFHFMTNGTVLLFTFFMITDPATTPNHPKARMLFAALVGVIAFLFTHVLYMQAGAPIWALFLVSPLTLVLDKLFQYRGFSWT